MKKNKLLINILTTIIPAFILFLILTNFVFTKGVISGNSMHGTYEDGYRCLTFKYDISNIKRFDTISFKNGEKLLIKRVIGLPNEKITYKNNQLYINDQYIEESFLLEDVITEDLEYVLKDNEYYCLGDNRNNSNDSRNFGPVYIDNVVGTHLFVYFPFNKIGFYK